MLALVFGILGMTNEYRHGTITYTYLDTPRRWMVIAVKLVCYGARRHRDHAGSRVARLRHHQGKGGALRGVPIDPASGSGAADYARQIGVAGLITTFGVALGALFRMQVVTVAADPHLGAVRREHHRPLLKPAVGVWLPFMVFNQVSAVRTTADSVM